MRIVLDPVPRPPDRQRRGMRAMKGISASPTLAGPAHPDMSGGLPLARKWAHLPSAGRRIFYEDLD